MIDTIKFFVPIDNESLLQKIKEGALQTKQQDLKTGDIKYVVHKSEVQVGSYSKAVHIKISETAYHTGLFIEFSIPKYAKGNNVEMLHVSELKSILEQFYKEISTLIETPPETPIPDISQWQIFRLDLCYNWLFKTKQDAERVMSFLQSLNHPRKSKVVYPTSVVFPGSAYVSKAYLKGPEFRVHDFNKMEDNDRRLELVEWADRIVRFEIELKKSYLGEVFGWEKVILEHIEDDSQIEGILSFYLNKKLLRYITLTNTTEGQAEQLIYANFSGAKALRLYQFYRDYFLYDGPVKRRIRSGGLHRSTIGRYKKDLNNIGVGFDVIDTLGESLLKQLVIPSESSRFELVGFPDNVPWRGHNSKVV